MVIKKIEINESRKAYDYELEDYGELIARRKEQGLFNMQKARMGKPYSQQPGRKRGKGKGKIGKKDRAKKAPKKLMEPIRVKGIVEARKKMNDKLSEDKFKLGQEVELNDGFKGRIDAISPDGEKYHIKEGSTGKTRTVLKDQIKINKLDSEEVLNDFLREKGITDKTLKNMSNREKEIIADQIQKREHYISYNPEKKKELKKERDYIQDAVEVLKNRKKLRYLSFDDAYKLIKDEYGDEDAKKFSKNPNQLFKIAYDIAKKKRDREGGEI